MGGVHAQGLAVPAIYVAHAPIGRKKREADAQLVTYPNGAVAPFDPNVAVATAQHYAAKAARGYYPYVGAANVHPAAVYYGRKKREADPQVVVAAYGAYPYAYGYAGLPVVAVAPFVAHPNGAVVPLEPEDVVKAREEHLAAVAEATAA